MRFMSREDAGQRLARRLRRFRDGQTVVLAIPRGGVAVGAEVARMLEVPLEVVLVSKIGHPYEPEYAIGAIAEDGQALYDSAAIAELGSTWLKQATDAARQKNEQRRTLYGEAAVPEVTGRTVIIVDDGVATGLTMEAAVATIRTQQPKRIIVGVPVMSPEAQSDLSGITDEIITLEKPDNFRGSVDAHYDRFEQVEDDSVRAILDEAANYAL